MNAVIIYIIGVSGSGKTTIGKKLAGKTAIPFFDADDLHSLSNKEKMKSGQPLTDEDREGWLKSLNELAKKQMNKEGAIIACSALKEKYRKILAEGIVVRVLWVFLQGSYQLIEGRINSRKGHFMPPALLGSQFESLEIPDRALTIDISKTPDEIVAEIVTAIKKLN
jgi:carbohydrate kinase (thermoresistant glucokinase family)